MGRPLIMTLVVRDEADIVDANIAYHLAQGVDHVLAIDHRSVDNTPAILQRYQRRGVLTAKREAAVAFDQARWVTQMARAAYSRWPNATVFHADADEFWWPHEGSLADAFDAEFACFDGVGTADRVNYLGPNLHGDSAAFLQYCQYRQQRSTNVLGRPLPGKVCHRANPTITIDHGNHKAFSAGRSARQITSMEVLHFPNRSLEQYIQKTQRAAAAARANTALPTQICSTWKAVDDALRAGTFGDVFPDQIITDQAISSWLTGGKINHCGKLARFMQSQLQWPVRTPFGAWIASGEHRCVDQHALSAEREPQYSSTTHRTVG